MSKIKNDGLDQYGAGPFEQQQFGTAGVEGVKSLRCLFYLLQRLMFCGLFRSFHNAYIGLIYSIKID